jgi:hypothetical protein
MLQRLSAPLQGGIRFLQLPMPAIPTAALTSPPAPSRERDIGVTVFRIDDTSRLASADTPAVLNVRVLRVHCGAADRDTCWPEPLSIFGSTDFDGA